MSEPAPDEKVSTTSKNVRLLAMVSLFSDLSSQMIYPLIPAFLSSLGVSPLFLGLIEGIAEAVAASFKGISGRLSDWSRKRKIFVLLGYGLSALSKPFLFWAGHWTEVLTIRFVERSGKAMRGAARDALLVGSVPADKKGAAFGFHRAMDRLGALLAPLLALLILSLSNENIRLVFLGAVIPALLSVVCIFFVKEIKPPALSNVKLKTSLSALSPAFYLFLVSHVLFAFGNSSNAFLLLKAGETGISTTFIPLVWVVYNAVCSLTAYFFGKLSDRIGRKPLINLSFLYYALVYLGFAFASKTWMLWGLFAAYGIYYGLSAGVFKAYIADLVPNEQRATAFGLFNMATGFALLPASLLMGFLWETYNSQVGFVVGAAFSLLACLLFNLGRIFPFSKP